MANEPSSRVKTYSHKGKSIVLIDLSNSKPEETIPAVATAQKIISTFPPKTALVLTNVSGAQYNKEVANAIKDLVSKNTPFIRASAVVGVNGIQDILLQTVIMISHRDIKTFRTVDLAKDWLASV
jgi:hypothetical protein